jgi:hypothetical protein
MNYDSLIERDLAAIPPTIASFRAEHSAEETWTAITRFAVLAFAPSQHSKHALLSCLSAWDLRDELGERFDDAIVECAVYAAASRQPWSEPPMLDPPRLDAGQRADAGELREAIASSDRLRAERWLAKRYRDPDFAHDYFTAASESFADLGHSLIVGAAAWRLASLLGEQGRYAMLRVGVWEMVALGGGELAVGSGRTSPDLDSLCAALVANIIANDGDIVSSHAIFLFDVALQTGDESVIAQVCEHLSTIKIDPTPVNDWQPHRQECLCHNTAVFRRQDCQCYKAETMWHRHSCLCSVPPKPPVYSFARDYGACLKAHAVAKRLRPRFPNVDFDRMLVAVHHNLDTAPSFEEMTFA